MHNTEPSLERPVFTLQQSAVSARLQHEHEAKTSPGEPAADLDAVIIERLHHQRLQIALVLPKQSRAQRGSLSSPSMLTQRKQRSTSTMHLPRIRAHLDIGRIHAQVHAVHLRRIRRCMRQRGDRCRTANTRIKTYNLIACHCHDPMRAYLLHAHDAPLALEAHCRARML